MQRTEGNDKMQNQSKESTLAILQNLLKVCTTVQHLFQNAADEVENPELKEVFISFANQKYEYGKKLVKEINRISGKSFEIPAFKQKLSKSKRSVDYISKMEETIEKNYASAMQDEKLLWEVIPIVAKQYDGIKESRKFISNYYGNA